MTKYLTLDLVGCINVDMGVTSTPNKTKQSLNLMKTSLVIASAVVLASSAVSAAEIKVGASYNTKDKSTTPVITVTQPISNTTSVQGWVNFKSGGLTQISEGQTKGQVYVEEAAYNVFDARDRFGIALPATVDQSIYSYDGTRLDGQPISGQNANGVTIKATRALVTATEDRAAVFTENPKTEVGMGVLTKFAGDVSIGAGVKTNFKNVTPYIQAVNETKLSEAISFFADVKVPLADQGVDISGGLSIRF